jgi:hypothetical protein
LAGTMMFGWSSRADAQPPTPSQQQSGPGAQSAQDKMGGQLPQGITPTKAAKEQTQEVHKVVQQMVQNALSKGDFDKVADYLTGRDRDRIAKANVSTDQLDRTIDQFNNQWRSQYNTNFKIVGKDQALQAVQPLLGQVSNPQQVASSWPVGQSGQRGSDADELEGRQVAVLNFPPAQQGSPGVTASLIQNEKGDWKFDIPNSIDAQTLVANLTKQINTCITMSNSWPKDPNQAYAVVAGQIIQAFYDTSSSGGQGAFTKPGQQPPQPGQQSMKPGQPPPQSGQQPSQPGQ